MVLQDRAVCFGCDDTIEHSPVFEAPCGHLKCNSAVWHGACLMEWREHNAERIRQIEQMWRKWVAEHTDHERGQN